MLYLAEYRKNKNSLLGFSSSELILIAYQNTSQSWSILSKERIVLLEKPCPFSNETMVTVNITNEERVIGEVIGEIKQAKPYILKILKDFIDLTAKQQQKQEEISQWKQSLEYQFAELERQKRQIRLEKQNLEYKRKAIKLLEAENQNIQKCFDSDKLKISSKKLLGQILKEANLISDSQIKLALATQNIYPELKIGKILALKGWIEPTTINFFASDWNNLLDKSDKYSLGFYLKQSLILTENQINIILDEQKELKLKFGEIAVLKGWLSPKTLNYFLENIHGKIEQKLKLLHT